MNSAQRREHLARAREMARAGQASVWEALLASSTADERAAWQGWLEREHGVAILSGVGSFEMEEGQGLLRDEAGLPYARGRRLPGGEACLVAADPWSRAVAMAADAQTAAVVHLLLAPSEFFAGLQESKTVANPSDALPGGVVEQVDWVIQQAVQLGASDIHWETHRQGLKVRLRLDGVLRDLRDLDGVPRAEAVISRIKVMAQLDITERRVPQDGRFRQAVGKGWIDLRVSIMPSVHGEDAVLRLLDRAQLRQWDRSDSLQALGFSAQATAAIRRLGRKPHGMLLVTGPTGSGKTTTIYGVLSEINSQTEKIVTIEDAVEYELEGVLQIPVNERKGLSFARGLRSILRHDPDRILVGEIRDQETAQIAVQSALTGHQVFTTVHANSLFDVIGRFKHFDLDMYGFLAALNGVVVQRLLRKLCPHCTVRREPHAEERGWMDRRGLVALPLPVGRGCDACGHLGYRGRFVLAEVHEVNDDLRDAIARGDSIRAVRQLLATSGAAMLDSLAMEAVAAGITSLEEVERVVGLA